MYFIIFDYNFLVKLNPKSSEIRCTRIKCILDLGAKWSPFENGNTDRKGVTEYSDGQLLVDQKSELRSAIRHVVSVFSTPLVLPIHFFTKDDLLF